MTSKRSPVLLLILATWLLSAPLSARATAIANSTLKFENLAITPAAGTFSLVGPWLLDTYAHADNSLGENITQHGEASAAAKVNWAEANGEVSVPNGPPDLTVTGSARSDVNIPGCEPAAAFANGRGTLLNFFTLSGGGPKVNVQFAIDIAGELNRMIDECGVFARTETVFTLEVDGNVVLFDRRVWSELSSQPGPFSEHLEDVMELDTVDAQKLPLWHSLLLEADSESSGQVVPEPSTGLLLVAGLAASAVVRRRLVRVRLAG